MVREILIWPDPRLREKATDLSAVDDDVRLLVKDMFETMYDANGVGLAAPQIGVSKRIVVADTSPRQEGAQPTAFINPVIVASEGHVLYTEGCLSVPGEAEDVERATKVRVQALDEQGRPTTVEAEGLLAIVLQHEIDHLDGVMFVDRISALKRELIKKRMKRLKAERREKHASRNERGNQPSL